MSAPAASGWSGRRVGLAPTGKAPPCHGARGKRSFAQKPAGMADRHSARRGEHNSGERTSARRAGGDDCIEPEAAAITVHREDQHQNQEKEISPRPVVIVVI